MQGAEMTLAIIIFLLATAVLLLVTIPFVMLMVETRDELWTNIKFWSVVAASWAVVWFAVSYGA
jgi:hypothetical protein